MKKVKKQKKVKRNKVALLFVLLFLLLVLFVLIINAYASNAVLAVHEVEMTLNVSDYVGLNLDDDKLHFGTVIKGGSSSRGIVLSSDVEGFVYVTSDLDWLRVKNQGVEIGPDNDANFLFEVYVPKDAEPESINENVYFYVLKHEKEWLLFFLQGELLDVFSPKNGGGIVSLNIKS